MTLAVCAGMQILGRTITDRRGHETTGLGLLDLTTSPTMRGERIVGEVVIRSTITGVGLLTGFENHSGATTLGPGAQPLGAVLRGVGNGGDLLPGARAGEGVCTRTIIGTYTHGPGLARNPALADHILSSATRQSLPELELPDQEPLRRNYLAAIASRRRPKLGGRG